MSCKKLFGVICGLHQIWIVLTSVVSGYSAYDPRFIGSLKNVTVIQGKDASFTCMVEHLGVHRIAWIKVDTKAILAIHDHVITNNARLSVTMNDKVTWTLHIRGVQRVDRGFYMCQINTEPMAKQMAYLEVVISPDITSEETSGDLMVPEGGTAKLICRAKGYPKPVITWRKEDGNHIIIKEGQGGKRKVKQFEGEVLTLSKITRSEMGAYLCIASNQVPPSVSKRMTVQVHFNPQIYVPNQLIAAAKGLDIMVECTAEASPKAINYWTRETGEMIIPNDKFNMSEEAVSQYGVRMHLLIRNLTARDFSGYKCISQNSMGSTEGTIHIHEINLSSQDKNSFGNGERSLAPADGEYSESDEESSSSSLGGGGNGNGNGGMMMEGKGDVRRNNRERSTRVPLVDLVPPLQPMDTPQMSSGSNGGNNHHLITHPFSNLLPFLLFILVILTNTSS